ncbi:MAG: HAD hydrolase family protein [bacterium]|nr:HAD hydrolase family protein [bacterium]
MPNAPTSETLERASRVRFVLLDVDGVLTDGRILMGSGDVDERAFYVRDGLGIRLGQRTGLEFGIVSGRESEVVRARATELDIDEVHQRIHDKGKCLRDLFARRGLSGDDVAFVGDDLIDLPAMRICGLAIAPADGADEVCRAAHHVTRSDGGRGAVREAIELILRAQGKWDELVQRFSG